MRINKGLLLEILKMPVLEIVDPHRKSHVHKENDSLFHKR